MTPETQRPDNFDLLRLIAAIMVLWSHQYVVTGYAQPEIPLIRGYLGSLGVFIFFGISGYLNTFSLLRRQSAINFLFARAVRIYPALIVCVSLTVVLGAVITTDPANYYGIRTLRYLLQNASMIGIQVRLPGVFNTNVYPDAVNNSIWTLPMEAACYIGLALIGALARFRGQTMLALIVGVALALLLFSAFVRDLTSDWLMAQDHAPRYYGVGFLGGALLALGERRRNYWFGVGLLFVVSAVFWICNQHLTAILILIPIAAVTIGKLPSVPWARPPIDISYGTYLYAFPVQQLIASYRFDFWSAAILSAVLSLTLGFVSAILIEQPALRWQRQRNLRQAPIMAVN